MDSGKGNFCKLKVLVVEDAPVIRVVLQNMFEELKCKVVTAENGQEAVERFDSDFNIVFIDYNMPVMNGCEAVKLIRQTEKSFFNKKPVYIIGNTAENTEEISHIFIEAGANKIIKKPIHQEALKELIGAVCP